MTPPNSSQGGEGEGSGAAANAATCSHPFGTKPASGLGAPRVDQAQHTPVPWACRSTDCDGPDYGVSIIGLQLNDDGTPLEKPSNGLVGAALPWPTEIGSGDFSRVEANAAFIVRACNSHDDLVEALSFYVIICGNTAASVDRQSAREAYTRAAAALAKARGEVA